MVPSPSSIITRAEQRRLDLLRDGHRERLAASAVGHPLPFAATATLGHVAAATVRRMPATLWLRLRRHRLRRYRREIVPSGNPPYPASVTRREIDVLALVATGLRST